VAAARYLKQRAALRILQALAMSTRRLWPAAAEAAMAAGGDAKGSSAQLSTRASSGRASRAASRGFALMPYSVRVTRITSSKVVVPSNHFFTALIRSVLIPSLMAISRILKVSSLRKMARRMVSLTGITS